jgi:hypothetical protein
LIHVKGMRRAGFSVAVMDTSNPNPSVQPLPPVAAPGEHQRRAMVAEAAYYLAERRGFAPGKALDDWLQAEDEIEALTRAAE